MKNIFYTLITFFFILSCSQGDVIVTEFNFDKDTLEICEATIGNFIYFKINNETQEGVSFNFSRTNFSVTAVDSFNIPINATNRLVYRKFNTTVDRNYYCGLLPPSNISVLEEYVSSGGTATITTEITAETEEILNDSLALKKSTYQTKILFENLTLNGPDERLVYQKFELEGSRIEQDTIAR